MVSLGVLGLVEDGEFPGGWYEVMGPKTGGWKEGREPLEPRQIVSQAGPEDYLARITSVLRGEF